MKIVAHPSELEQAFYLTSNEAQAAFGDGSIYVERFILNPRHVEVQVLGDESGNVIHLGERECSLQRRHQKILEEAGAPNLRPEVAAAMHETAAQLARDVGYRSAGTVEFLVDDNQDFFFIEMNTRIQVEHPVTEFRTGIDLVKEQIRIAAGKSLRWTQDDIQFRGHAIECRINAEDPVTFRPSPGTITGYHEPGGLGVRVDSAVHDRCTVLPYYDSMLAKLVAFGENRSEALERMRSSLSEYVIEGIQTNIPLHLRILNDPDFIQGRLDTGYVERLLEGGR